MHKVNTMKKAAPYILLLLMALLIVVIKKCRDRDSSGAENSSGTTTSSSRNTSSDQVNRDRGFDRRVSFLEYSNHARCRMQCRYITQEEVKEIMREGKINYYKSDIKNARCPRYAVEGITADKQKVRIVFAQCNEKTNVVTVIDLDTDWSCDCPGDDKKYENRN